MSFGARDGQAIRPARLRDEAGSALVEFVWLGLVLLVPLVWILLSLFEIQRGSFAVTSAARAAGRAYSLAPDQAAARERAVSAARLALDDQGGSTMPLVVEVECTGGPGNCLAPSTTVTVTVRSGVRLPFLPAFLSSSESDFDLEASHSVPIGQYVERR